jgi:hypothetical protein
LKKNVKTFEELAKEEVGTERKTLRKPEPKLPVYKRVIQQRQK